jgi:hypothetical protein
MEATDLAPLDIKARLIRAALWFVPRANPDYERLFPHVRKWLLEVDESGRVQREIGVASDGTPLFAAPDDRNLGFWTDSDKTFLKSELTPLAASEFEQLWMRASTRMKRTLLVTVQEGSTVPARSRQELADLLAGARHLAQSLGRLAIITLESESGATLSIVVGGDESVLAFDASLDPPYFVSKGASDEEKPGLDCYLHFEHHTEFSRDQVIPFSVGEQAVYEFLEMGVRPECVRWQEG